MNARPLPPGHTKPASPQPGNQDERCPEWVVVRRCERPAGHAGWHRAGTEVRGIATPYDATAADRSDHRDESACPVVPCPHFVAAVGATIAGERSRAAAAAGQTGAGEEADLPLPPIHYEASTEPREGLFAAALDAAEAALRKRGVDNYWHYFQGVANNMLAELQRDAAALLAAPDERSAPEPQPEAEYGWGNRAWRKGYMTALSHIQRFESGDPTYWESPPISAFQYRSLAMVVDAEGMDWVASA